MAFKQILFKKMKIIVSGSESQIAKCLQKDYTNNKNYQLYFFDKKSFDISNYDGFMFHSIESPFIKKHFIESAINVYKIFNPNTVISVTEDNRQFFNHTGKGLEPINYKEGIIRYEKEKCFVGSPGFLLRDCKDFVRNESMLGSRIGHVTIDKLSSFVIEDDLDMKIANYLSKIHINSDKENI